MVSITQFGFFRIVVVAGAKSFATFIVSLLLLLFLLLTKCVCVCVVIFVVVVFSSILLKLRSEYHTQREGEREWKEGGHVLGIIS